MAGKEWARMKLQFSWYAPAIARRKNLHPALPSLNPKACSGADGLCYLKTVDVCTRAILPHPQCP